LKEVSLYIDGSCWGNPGPGGWAAILVYKGTEREFFGSDRQTTSSRMELRAAIEGLRRLKESCRVSVEGDSQYVVRAFNDGWLEGWQRRGWRKVDGDPVLNHDLWEELLAEVGKHEVRWAWVRGHAGNPYNERCHTLAVRGCKAAIPGGWGRQRGTRRRSSEDWSPARDAAMRMHSEAARLPICPECGYSDERHAPMCPRAS